MTSILLIRHGQASFGAADYDMLSPLGIEQARLVGTHLAREGRSIAAIHSGTLRRQADTAHHARGEFSPSHDISISADFNEYPLDELLGAYLPIATRDKRLHVEAMAKALSLWQSGVDALVSESWVQFCDRIKQGLEVALSGRQKEDVIAVFTSAGVISALISGILGLPPTEALRLNWRICNASISEIHYGRSGYTLCGFNSAAHLRLGGGPDFVTYL